MADIFTSVLRTPDSAFGATEATEFRFEEAQSAACDVKYEYKVENGVGKVIVYPSASPVKYLKLRFRGDFSAVEKVYGDEWERSGATVVPTYLEWSSVMPHKAMPWFCYAIAKDRMACYGVKVGPDCFAYWQLDRRGVTLFLNLTNGNGGTDLKEPLLACEVVELFGDEGEDPFYVAKRFAHLMSPTPKTTKEPIFGVNNWYWAYGKISHDSVMQETDYLMQMCDGTHHRPYMIIDDGWQINRSYGSYSYIGGPWVPNEKFPSMSESAAAIHEKGAKTGIWFRPLLTLGDTPNEANYATPPSGGGIILDPSHPYTLERVECDARSIRNFGFDLIKHDFTTMDITGNAPLSAMRDGIDLFHYSRRRLFDNTKTSATIIKNLYLAIQRGAGEADVIGCNTVSHLTAGIHSIYRVGNDTSGRSFEWTRRFGVNSVMRLPLNEAFYRVDPDCAAFTSYVDESLNLDFLEMCALTGMTTLASVTPNILSDAGMKRINEIYKISDRNESRFGIVDYDKCANPEVFSSQDGKEVVEYDWEKAYDGARSSLHWMN
jgi:alpha-galactosidase